MAYPRAMTLLRRRRLWREPPIVFQILVLLFGGLIVAQLVTLLLTLVFPPAPPIEHGMSDIVATLRGERDDDRLARVVQSGPPDVSGIGWFTSDPSRHDLAIRLGARDGDVRLAFFAPVPFAGITAPPSRPPTSVQPTVQPSAAVSLQQISWSISTDPLVPLATRLHPAELMLVQQGVPAPGGGAPGGGFPGGGYGNGMGFPGGGGSSGRFPGNGNGRSGQQGNRGTNGGPAGGDMLRQDQGQRGGAPSPYDLDRQPAAPDQSQGGAPAGSQAPGGSFGGGGPQGHDFYGGRVPTEGFDPRSFAVQPQQQAAPQTVTPDAAPAFSDRAAPTTPAAVPAARSDITEASRPTTAPQEATARPAPVIAERESEPEARALPIAPPSRGLFGLAPAPFVEGDFVAALRLSDGRWAVVQPLAEGFPNAWQRRVMLWFVIAFGIVAPIGWLFARHIVRPLARFTEAAEQLGRDPSAALVALEGPAEIGRAAHAFNVMQNRLRSFVDDRTAMVGAISHDLRTPLTRMRFRIEEVGDDGVREGMAEEVTEMEAMITSVLNFIRDASTPNVRERMDLCLLVEDVAQDAAMVGGRVTIEQVAQAPVEVDVLGMRRLLTNLVENAVKYGDCARIRLAIEDDAAVADILDDGPGVPENELERAFEPFYRASNAAASGKNGTGLGLAVCRSIARAHGGDVLLIRSPEGFAAQLRLPLAYDASSLAA